MIKLDDVIMCMEMSSEENCSYYNTTSNKIVNIFFNEVNNEEDEDALEIIEDGDIPEYYISLPDKYDIDEYHIMQEFIYSLEDEFIQDELLDVINGRRAFRRFKDTLYEYGIENKWYEYRDKAYRKIALDWLDANNIKYEE